MTIEKLDETIDAVETVSDIATVGAILKTARENKGITIEAAALQLHLRPKILTDIEADNFDNIASNTYARGYIKNYARFIEADIDAIKSCLNQQIPEHVPPTMQSFSRKTSREARDSRLNLVTYAIVIILLAMLVLWWVQKSDLITQSNFALPTVEELQAEATIPGDDYTSLLEPTERVNSSLVAPVDAGSNDANSEIVSAQSESAQPPASVSTEAVNVTNTESANVNGSAASDLSAPDEAASAYVVTPQVATPNQIATNNNAVVADGLSVVTISLTADCWINLVDVNGKVLVDGVKTAGHQVNVSGKAPFKLILGAPQAVLLTLDGNKVDLSEYDNGRVARITLTQPN
ncbi:RodZ domain-containing protein [Shewanella holmiensis]|uniref:DUF4115 domain-containing protein n=1 Tax=Shewanella holmiensis TaxID=2952222 RepID=A0A9X2WPJ2_9GAMM|nr:RodZ domain-containing protein [Shewanella holmiensis]MCT7943168.1 DUF4115 domain-containing protein [Shewanella holmiensis]